MASSKKEPSVHGLFIDGREVPATRPDLLDVINPATGEVLAQISHGSDEDVDRAVRSSRAAFDSPEGANMSKPSRAKLMNKLADVFEANLDEMYQLETANNGRSLNETRAQISRLPDFFRYNAGLATPRPDLRIPA